MSNPDLILCVPHGTPGYVPGPDYQLLPCVRCQRRCWVGPISKQRIDSGMTNVLCIICALTTYGPGLLDSMRVLDRHSKSRIDPRVMNAAMATMTREQIEQLGRD